MTYKMFLDDLRDPQWSYPAENVSDWIVCRSVQEAQNVFSDLGWPTWISFDHDLGDNVPSGYDLAKWLVEHDLEANDMPREFSFEVHSANPVGGANIRSLLTNYLKFKFK